MKTPIKLFVILLSTWMLSAPVSANQSGHSCWGQASAVFAQMGMMGEHSSTQGQPRLGLANLARALYDAGVIPEPTITALGVFVADALGFSIDACMSDEAAVAEAELASAANAACWGQASAVFGQMGIMGQHASEQDEPRMGLRNLARQLADLGIIPDDSLASLGAYLNAELGLGVEACM